MRIIKIVISFLVISSFLWLNAANVDSVFLKLPAKLLPLLDGGARYEMLEYFKAGQTDSVKNKLGGFARIIYRDTTSQHIVLNASQNSIIDIRLFKTTDSTYITGVIHTVGEGVVRSNIEFFHSDGSSLYIEMPVLTAEDWYRSWITDVNVQVDGFKAKLLSYNFLKMGFSKTDSLIEVQNYSVKLLNDEHQKMIAQFTGNKQTEDVKQFFRVNSYLCTPFIEKLK